MTTHVLDVGKMNHCIWNVLIKFSFPFVALALFIPGFSNFSYAKDCSKEPTKGEAVSCLQNKIANLESQSAPKTSELPRGIILPWTSKTGELPDGWAICNGDNGTPDLTNKFLMGMGRQIDTGKWGGKNDNTVSVKLPRRSLEVNSNVPNTALLSKSNHAVITHTPDCKTCGYVNSFIEGEKISSESFDNRPEYYTVVFIMKL